MSTVHLGKERAFKLSFAYIVQHIVLTALMLADLLPHDNGASREEQIVMQALCTVPCLALAGVMAYRYGIYHDIQCVLCVGLGDEFRGGKGLFALPLAFRIVMQAL